MKYILEIFKRKQWKILAVVVCTVALGLCCIYYNLIDYIVSGLNSDGSYIYAAGDSALVAGLSATNLGMVGVGLIILWTGLIFLPHNSPYLQNEGDYSIENKGDKVHIKFKKNEWLVDKEKFEPTDLFFKDKNGKFVSVTRGYQVYNYYRFKTRK